MAISLNNHEERIKNIDDSIKSMSDRIVVLESKPSGAQYEVYTINSTQCDHNRSWTLPEKYKDWNFSVMECAYGYEGISSNGLNSVTIRARDGKWERITKKWYDTN